MAEEPQHVNEEARDEVVSGLQYLRSNLRDSYGRLHSVAKGETNQLRIVPGGPVLVYGLTGALAAAFGIFGLGIHDIYTESILFLVAATSFGLLTQTTGIVFLLVYSLLNLLTVLDGLTADTFLGRLISYAVLAILVVGIPNVQRRVFAVLSVNRVELIRRVAAPVISSAVAAALAYLWSVVTPYLIRPVFPYAPTVQAVSLLQQKGWLLSVLVFAVSLTIATTFQRLVGVPWERVERSSPTRPTVSFELWRRLGLYTLTLVAMRGLVTSFIDVFLLLGTLAGGDVLVSILFKHQKTRSSISKIPYPFRFVAAYSLTLVAAYGVLNKWYRPTFGSEFFPLVLSLAIGFVIFHMLLGVDEKPTLRANRPARGVPLLWIAFTGAGISLAAPGAAWADNCSGLQDCAMGSLWCSAAGLAAIVAAIWAFIKNAGEFIWDWIDGVFGPDPIPWSQGPLTPEAVEAQRAWIKTERELRATRALVDSGPEEWQRIRNLSDKEFIREFAPGASDQSR